GIRNMAEGAGSLLRRQRFRAASQIAAVYLITSFVYLYSSDWLVAALVPEDWAFAVNVSKGFIYVTVTGAALLYFIHRALVAAQMAEAQFQHIFDAIPDGILLGEGTGIVLAANPAMVRMLGRTPEEVIGHPRTVFIDEESPELMAIL